MNDASSLSVANISFVDGTTNVLFNINFLQRQSQKIVIAGETGSGKSTLLKIIAGLEQPTRGDVFLNDEKVKGPADQLVPGNPEIAYLSQHFELPKSLRVEQVLDYANTLSQTQEAKIFTVCRINHLLRRKTNELSGGEKQRIAIARLLIQQPKLLLLDEPYSNLDRTLKGILKSVIDDIGKKLKITCILVSHDPDDTLPWADEILVLRKGKIIQRGTPQEIYHSPINTYVAGLFGAYNVLNSSFFKKLGVKNQKKKIIVRPEDFQVTAKGSNTIHGFVEKANFFGGHQLIEVIIDKDLGLIVVRDANKFALGEKVYLKLRK